MCPRDRGAADSGQRALRRSLELAAKDVAAIARIFLQTDFVSAIRKFDPTSAQVAPANAAAIGANGI